MKCHCDNLPSLFGFEGWKDYDVTKKLLEEKVNQKIMERLFSEKLETVHVGVAQGDTYKCTRCGKLWHMIEPEFPYKGGFLPREDFRLWKLGEIGCTKSPRKFPSLEKFLREEKDN